MREYNSLLACYITGLIKQKQSCGYIYDYEAYILEWFDRFCIKDALHHRNNNPGHGHELGNPTAH